MYNSKYFFVALFQMTGKKQKHCSGSCCLCLTSLFSSHMRLIILSFFSFTSAVLNRYTFVTSEKFDGLVKSHYPEYSPDIVTHRWASHGRITPVCRGRAIFISPQTVDMAKQKAHLPDPKFFYRNQVLYACRYPTTMRWWNNLRNACGKSQTSHVLVLYGPYMVMWLSTHPIFPGTQFAYSPGLSSTRRITHWSRW